MKVLLLTNLLLFSGLFLFCPQLAAMEAEKAISCLAAGIGWEQLTYKEEIPELALISSDTELHNLVLYLEGQKGWRDFFLGARGNIPLSTGESREDWTRAGAFEQSNSLTYRWFRADVHAGYFLHQLLNPYVGVGWSYAEQERSNFDNVSIPGIVEETVTEKVNSFSALLGIQGGFQLAARWSLSYSAEYMLPFYSKTTNTGFSGWEASNIGGYSYSFTGRLTYAFSENISAGLQVSGGKQHWDGSDWIPVGDSSAKWPENETDFISTFISICRKF